MIFVLVYVITFILNWGFSRANGASLFSTVIAAVLGPIGTAILIHDEKTTFNWRLW